VSDDNGRESEIAKAVLFLQERDGVCTPAAFVEYSRDESSPLHSLFPWDDEVAGELYRIHKARHIIGRVKIRCNDSETPAHVHVTITRGDGTIRSGYAPIEVAMSNEDMRRQIFAEARAGLNGWRKRLAAFDQASGTVHLITEAIERLRADEEEEE
jgi:hypothetical protein